MTSMVNFMSIVLICSDVIKGSIPLHINRHQLIVGALCVKLRQFEKKRQFENMHAKL